MDLRDRSEPGDLRTAEPPEVPSELELRARKIGNRAGAHELRVAVEPRHLEPVEPFTCPRCHQPAEGEAFYGPCGACRQSLRTGATVVAAPSQGPTSAPVEPAAEVVVSGPVLRRQHRRHRDRNVVYRAATSELADLLHELPAGTDRVVMTGPRPGTTAAGDRAWYCGELPPGWTPAEGGHYLGGATPIGKYTAPDGRRVAVHRAADWFGEGDYGPAAVEAAMAELAGVLGGPLLATAATTGRELLLRSLPEREEGWPVLSEEHQTLLRSISGQGRSEVFDLGRPELPELHEYDGRFMYSALCWGLGAGPAELVERPSWEPRARAWYEVCATVPAGWSGPGLLGVKDDDGETWRYPAQPGEAFYTWADGAELFMAERHGWRFTVLRQLRLTDSKANPLGGWADRLVKARDACALPLAAKACRSILLKTVGTLHGRPHTITKTVHRSEARAIPDEADVDEYGDQLVYTVQAGQAWPAMCHPEWSAGVWARCRARLLSGPGGTGALHLQAGEVVAFRTDAVYVTARQPSWEAADDGATGRLQYRGGTTEPLPAPTTTAALLRSRPWRDNR